MQSVYNNGYYSNRILCSINIKRYKMWKTQICSRFSQSQHYRSNLLNEIGMVRISFTFLLLQQKLLILFLLLFSTMCNEFENLLEGDIWTIFPITNSEIPSKDLAEATDFSSFSSSVHHRGQLNCYKAYF